VLAALAALGLGACDDAPRGAAPGVVPIAPLDEPGGAADDPGDLLARPLRTHGRPAALRITPAMPGVNRHLAGGWAPPERWGSDDPPVVRRWSLGDTSRVRFELDEVEPLVLSLRALPYQPPGGRPQQIDVSVNGEFLTAIAMDSEERSYQVALPAAVLRKGANHLRFEYLWTEQPGRVDPASTDLRPLAIAFSEIAIEPRSGPVPDTGALVSVSTPSSATPLRGLRPPRAGHVSALLWPPPGSQLALGWVRARADGDAPTLRVEAEWDHGRSLLLARRVRSVAQVETAVLPLPHEAEGALRLLFSVEGGGEEPGLVWLEPRIVPPAPDAAPRAPLRAPPGTNLVVIVLDAAARDRTSVYGGETETTPQLARLAGESLVFDAAYASASHTFPSTAALFTSRLPPQLGATDTESPLGPERPTLAEQLAAHGYVTAAFSANPFVSTGMGTTRGFARVDELFRDRPPGQVARGEEFLPPVRAFLTAHRDGPFFAYVHLLQPHEPYDAAPDSFYAGRLDPAHRGRFDGSEAQIWEVYRRHLYPTLAEIAHIHGLYEGNLAYADSIVGAICRTLGELGLWERTIVVVTADHGEALGEHGSWGHGEGVTREQIAIPLVVRLPPGLVAPGRRSDLVTTVDLMPSVLELLGIEAPPGLQGRSWFAPHGAHEWPRSVLSVAQGRDGIASVIAPGFKYSRDPTAGSERLLPLPAEEAGSDLRFDHPVTFAYLAEEVARLMAPAASGPARAPAALPDDVRAALRALGYVEE